jgi:hypothetical protein
MHRLWRGIVAGMLCAVLAWPAVGMAYIRPGDIVEADPVSENAVIALSGDPDESGDVIVESSSDPEYDQLYIPLFWNGGIVIPMGLFH